MPTKGREGHDAGKPEGVPAHPANKHDSDHPGYETQDVNIGGVIIFLSGLMGFLVVFFFVCFYLGKVINISFVKADGAPDRWHPYGVTHNADRQNLTPNPVTEQKELADLTRSFPTPRVVADDSNQETAEMHAREDLLLDNYSVDNGVTRIPIDQAMQLIAQRGLGSAPAQQPRTLMAGDVAPSIHAPLTTGFARTGYELDTIAARDQKNSFTAASAEAGAHKE